MTKKNIKKEKEEVNINSEAFRNKQLRNITLIMGVVILVTIIAYLVTNNLSNPSYRGLQFTKNTQGGVDFYIVKVPAIDPLTGKTQGYYDMILRTNPKELDKIEYDGRTKILRNVIMSFDRAIEGCEDNVIAVANMARFLTDAGFQVKGASHEYEYAQETNMTYATCADAENSTVIVLQKALNGETTSVRETVNNCYIVNIAECQTLPALERMMTEIAIEASKQGQ
ncbi:MAG: hypothetical protein AABW73_02975 [Nanoarchaeota archaeon]